MNRNLPDRHRSACGHTLWARHFNLEACLPRERLFAGMTPLTDMTSRFATTLAFALAALSLSACDESTAPAAPTPPRIVKFESAYFAENVDTLKADQRMDFFGSLSDKSGLTAWSLVVLDTIGDTMLVAKLPSISGTSIDFDVAGKSAYNLSITNPGTWGPTASFLARLTVSNSAGLSSTKDIRFLASPASAPAP